MVLWSYHVDFLIVPLDYIRTEILVSFSYIYILYMFILYLIISVSTLCPCIDPQDSVAKILEVYRFRNKRTVQTHLSG